MADPGSLCTLTALPLVGTFGSRSQDDELVVLYRVFVLCVENLSESVECDCDLVWVAVELEDDSDHVLLVVLHPPACEHQVFNLI